MITYSGNKTSDNYATKRERSYPELEEQFDLLYHAIDAGEFVKPIATNPASASCST